MIAFQFIPCGRRRTIARALYFIFRIAFGVCAQTGKRQVCSPKGSAERTCPTAVCAGQIQTFFFLQLKKVFHLRKLITEPSSGRFWGRFSLVRAFPLYTSIHVWVEKKAIIRQVPWFRSWVLLNRLKEAICIAGNIWQQRVHSTPQVRLQAATYILSL